MKKKRDSKSARSGMCALVQRIVIAGALGFAAFALPIAATAGIESDPALVKLEVKFFQHDYGKDDTDARLQRLEKLVFGDAKTGDPQVRLQHLISAVPNLDAVDTSAATGASSGSGSGGSGMPQNAAQRPSQPVQPAAEDLASREKEITGSSQYPAVSAIEKKVLGRDFAQDPIAARLDRLETKLNGKPSGIDDLSERVDRLKSRTGVDIAASPPPGTDWADDEDEPRGGGNLSYVPADTTPFAPSRIPPTNLGGTGGYGMGGPSPSGYTPGGSYGYNPPASRSSGVPQSAPDVVREPSSSPGTAVGLNQRVASLETEVYKKTYGSDPLPARITRLESTVFGNAKADPAMSLPERVSRLAETLGPQSPVASGRRVAQRRNSDDDLGDDPQMPQPAPPRSSLSKIINGLGNLMGGGASGAYPTGSRLITDPQTGMLVDAYSGNIIDPRTGAVVGNRSTGIPANTFGALPYSGFNNGLSPVGNSYGMGTGMQFGSGFGSGSRFGGMGVGVGSGGGMGMGVWP